MEWIAENHDADLIESLRAKLAKVLRPLLEPRRNAPVAWLDFPWFPNVGDSAIWLGERTFFRSMGVSICYTACHNTTSISELAKRIGKGTIFIHGGGNFGDVYEHHQVYREKIIQSFPNNRIIQFPNTINFQRRDTLLRARRVINQHPDFVLLVRDRASFAFAKENFTAQVFLCPDMAFYLGRLPRTQAAETEVLWLKREDNEATDDPKTSDALEGIPRENWEQDDSKEPFGINHFLMRRLQAEPSLERYLRGILSFTYHPVAQRRLLRGRRLLSRAASIITDRLHGHVLCILLGVPHCVMPDRFGKIRGFHQAWTAHSRLATWCETRAEAISALRRRAVISQGPAIAV